VPLVLAGDEVANSQAGNNNAYCQDNETGWISWDGLNREGDDLIDFIGHITELRRRFPADPLAPLARWAARRWLVRRVVADAAADEMKDEDWNFPEGRFLSYVLGSAEHGQAPIFIVLNAAPEEIAFKLPKLPEYKSWHQLLNTAEVKQRKRTSRREARQRRLPARSSPFRGRHE
jgi:glycogen operon protein